MKTCVVIPTYNERENIGALVEEIFKAVPNVEIMVVDDNSPDGTANVIRELQKTRPRLGLIVRPGKLGYASAYIAAFKWILDREDFELVVTMDADFSHHPKYLPAILEAARVHTLVVGSRYVPGGRVLNWSLRRRLLSRYGNLYAKVVTGTPLSDLTTGFTCVRTEFLRRMPLGKLHAGGYAWGIEFKTAVWRAAASIKEVPITFANRQAGRSKISTHIIYEGLIEPWRIRFLSVGLLRRETSQVLSAASRSTPPLRTRVIIPTYNERENVIELINKLLLHIAEGVRVLVVDDNSPDGTADLVRDYAKNDSRVELMTRPAKLGMGSAYQAAFRRVLDEGGDDCIITIDADFSHNPKYVPELIRVARNYDLVIGSRYVAGGGVENWELWRRLLSWGGNLYVRMITGLPIRDCTAGFSCMRTDFLRRVPFDKIKATGYAWWFALRMMFCRRGARIKEIPIVFTERRLGQSKINTHVIYEGLIEPWRIRFTNL